MWGAIIERGPADYGVIVTGVAANSATAVGVTDYHREAAASLDEAESRREAMIKEAVGGAAERGDRIISLERLVWRLG